MSKQRTLYIGSHFGGLNFYEEDGSALTAALIVGIACNPLIERLFKRKKDEEEE